jgi:hypothetical protein
MRFDLSNRGASPCRIVFPFIQAGWFRVVQV